MDTDKKMTVEIEAPQASPVIIPTDFANAELLPNSLPRETKGVVIHRGIPWVPIFCANCGCDGGFIPEDAAIATGFAFYICVPCCEKWEPLVGTMVMPDTVFWECVKQEQLERYGRELTAEEVLECLKDDSHPLSQLTKDRFDWKKSA